jgi:gamma-aminobutyric acid type B receptor
VVDNTSVLIGYFDEDKEHLVLEKDAEFVDDSFPSKKVVVHPILGGSVVLITILVLALIVAVHILTLLYNKFSYIRASSYRVGQLTFIGCYMIVLCLLCFTLQKISSTPVISTTTLCVIQVWSLSLGFTLILGTVAAKTWRLYRIFCHLRKPGKLLHDWVLIVVVFVLATVDVVLCSVWTAEFRITTVHHEVRLQMALSK